MKLKIVVVLLLLSLELMGSVDASYTDDLKQNYADGSFYIEYQVMRQTSKGDIAKKQRPGIWIDTKEFDTYTYAQKGTNKYYKHDNFVATRTNHTGNEKFIDKILDNYRETAISMVQMKPLSCGDYYNVLWDFAEIQNEDTSIVRNGKIYALNRYDNSGYWTTAEKINEKPRLMQIMCANMIVPTIFNSILFPVDNTGINNFISSETMYTMGEDLLCETYTYQKTNEYGSPIGELWYFQLFYQDGQLKYFSDALSQKYYKRLKGKSFELLNNVHELKPLNEESIFNVIDDYTLKEFEVE